MSTDEDAQYIEPDWTDDSRVHNWRNYISDELQRIWGEFTPAQRIAIGRNAEDLAGREDWD